MRETCWRELALTATRYPGLELSVDELFQLMVRYGIYTEDRELTSL